MSRHSLSIRSLQLVAVGAAYALWLLTQHLLENTRGVVYGFTDHTHQLLAGINGFLNAHPRLADVVLAVSSLEVDLAAMSMVVFFFARRESRPLVALWLILIIRQLCQASISIPAPEGMIWRYPGFPSVMVTYSTSTDFFFSGHMALATVIATELTAQGATRGKQAVAWTVAGIQAFVILSMRFHYLTDVVTGCLAAIAATQLANVLGRRLDRRLAPWSSFPGGFAPPDPPTPSLAPFALARGALSEVERAGAPVPRSAPVARSLRSLAPLTAVASKEQV